MNKTKQNRTCTYPLGCKARSEDPALEHSATLASLVQFECTHCSEAFEWKKDLVVHLTSHYSLYASESCSETFMQGTDLKKHNEQCPVETPQAFKSKSTMKDKARSHSGKKSYVCSFCRKALNCQSQLDQHIRIHTFYSKASEQLSQLDQHTNTHTDKRGYRARCREVSGQKSQLNEHSSIRKVEKPHQAYACTSCDKSFARKVVLACHMKEHDTGMMTRNEKNSSFKIEHDVSEEIARSSCNKVFLVSKNPYKCSSCNKDFSKKYALIQHARVHSGEKPYECTFCNKTFKQQSQRNQHIRIHTGEKPYICPLCDTAFVQQSHLNQHWRLHTGEKPYVCTICGSAFVQKCHLDCHVKIHTAEEM